MFASDEALGMLYEERNHIKPYVDEVFQRDHEQRVQFIRDVHARGMVEFREVAQSIITPFFVTQKNGRLRLVLDCRASNRLSAPPPDIALAAGYSFGQLEVGSEQVMYMAQSDVKDYFYSIGLPEELRGFCSLPMVQFSQLGLDPSTVQCSTQQVYPCMRVVPMGWSWATRVAQKNHQRQAWMASSIPPSQVLADGMPAPSFVYRRGSDHTYMQTTNVCGGNQQTVQDTKDKVIKQLRSVGFRVHDERNASPVAQALGFILDGEDGEVRPIALKRDKLRLVLLWLATRPKVSGKAVEGIVGHCVRIFMLRREFLSVFRVVYDFKLAHYRHPSRLRRSAAKGFRWAAALLLVCNSNLRRPWSDAATASDASLSGTVVSMLRSSSETTQARGVCREMWRFKSKDPLNRARDAVLKLDPFTDVLSVKPILGEKLDPCQINATRVLHPEHITLLEARGSWQAIRHKLRSFRSFGFKHLHLGDSLGVALAFDRGRAKSVPLLMCCSRAAAYCVAGHCSFTHRWIPSEWNPADGLSRQWEAQRVPTCSKRHLLLLKAEPALPKAGLGAHPRGC